MIAANKPEDQVVIYTIHESDRGQKVRWLLEVMVVPYEVVLMNRQVMPEQYAEISLIVLPLSRFRLRNSRNLRNSRDSRDHQRKLSSFLLCFHKITSGAVFAYMKMCVTNLTGSKNS